MENFEDAYNILTSLTRSPSFSFFSQEGGGSNRASMDEADLKDIMGQAKAETVAAIMAIEALNFDDDD